jgi:hypothetical protein
MHARLDKELFDERDESGNVRHGGCESERDAGDAEWSVGREGGKLLCEYGTARRISELVRAEM